MANDKTTMVTPSIAVASLLVPPCIPLDQGLHSGGIRFFYVRNGISFDVTIVLHVLERFG